jgi:quercetin dioxygenase-like cupin family protein
MRWILIVAAALAPLTVLDRPIDAAQSGQAAARALIDNARVRVYRASAGPIAGVEHGPAVVVSLDDSSLGSAVWVDDAAAPQAASHLHGTIVVVQPRGHRPPSPPAGSKPGEAPFTGMSFTPVFENDRVSVIRARMEVGAREAFHTHGSDTLVVHLSGGEIEDTADGKTVVNRWKRGDVEFEAFGSSHSARNTAGAVDVVLVALKP